MSHRKTQFCDLDRRRFLRHTTIYRRLRYGRLAEFSMLDDRQYRTDKVDFKDPSAPTVATEFVTPAITSGGDDTPYGPYYTPMIPFNPHIGTTRLTSADTSRPR